MKTCTKCKQDLNKKFFYADNNTKDKLASNCKKCKQANRAPIIKQMLNNAKKRSKIKNLEFNLDLDFLNYLKNKQDNKCILTGVELNWDLLPVNKQRICPIDRASLDRIDSSKGYTKDNVQLVTDFCNKMKFVYTMDEIIYFCHMVFNNN